MITDKVGGSSAKPEVSKQSKEKRLKHKVSGYKSQSKRRSIAGCRLLLRTLKVVILPELLFCEMAFFHLHLANMSFFTGNKLSPPIKWLIFRKIWAPLILATSGWSRARWLEKRPSRKKQNANTTAGVCPVLKRLVNSYCTDSIRSTNEVKREWRQRNTWLNWTMHKTKSNFDSTTAHTLQATYYFQKRCRVK